MTDEDDSQESQRGRLCVPWWGFVLFFLSAAAVVTWFMWNKTPEETSLRGVLVDLELHPSDTPRHTELRNVLTMRLTSEEETLHDTAISLDSIHFSEFTSEFLDSRNVDFIVLSPQGTPWHLYAGESAARLESVKRLLQELILKRDTPVLGICGGHQFMTLAFGGAVGFIDPRLHGSFPDRYPPGAVSERGLSQLETLQDDPIFAGVAKHPGTFAVMESHYEEVKQVPVPFVNLARSELSEAQLIRIPGKPVYGMAFHPERGWDSTSEADRSSTSGRRMLANFVLMVSRHKSRFHARQSRSSSVSR